MNELALFAGAGGGVLAGTLLGWRCVCAVELDPYRRAVLAARQNDGALEPFPIWDDVRTFDGRPWRGLVDVVSGGFPCQDVSLSSSTRNGLDGVRSGLWREMARVIGEVRPAYVFVENSSALVRRGLDAVLGDLAALGFDARWGVFRAADVGAPHLRERLFLVANANKIMVPARPRALQQPCETSHVAWFDGLNPRADRGGWLALARNFHRVDDGLAPWVERVAALGDGQVPAVAARAFQLLEDLTA